MVICKKHKEEANKENLEENEVEELQLHDDEKITENKRKRHRSNELETKIEAIELARKESVRGAARKFRVDPNTIRGWIKQEAKLKEERFVFIFFLILKIYPY